MIVDGLREVLAGAEVALGGQHRSMAEQELDLLEFAAGGAAEFGAGAPGVMRSELGLADFGAVAPDHLPDGVLADAAREHLAALVHGAEDRTGLDPRALEPGVEQQLDPGTIPTARQRQKKYFQRCPRPTPGFFFLEQTA